MTLDERLESIEVIDAVTIADRVNLSTQRRPAAFTASPTSERSIARGMGRAQHVSDADGPARRAAGRSMVE